MKIIGIDPGSKGCIVSLNTETRIAKCLNIPYIDGVIDVDRIKGRFTWSDASMVILEKVHGRKEWGISNVFSFGQYYGQMRLFLYNKPHILLDPQTWQKIAHLGTSVSDPKAKSFQSFQRLNPNAKKIKKSYDGLIDAYHIARYGLFYYGVQFKDDWEFVIL